MRLRSLIQMLTLSTLLLDCGGSGGSPGGPSEPPPPSVGANIIASGPVSFGLCNGPGGGCSYSQEYYNAGAGCANSVRGKIRAYEDETLLESDDWWLETTFVLPPGERTVVEDCCLSQNTVEQRTRTTGEAFWNNIPCS